MANKGKTSDAGGEDKTTLAGKLTPASDGYHLEIDVAPLIAALAAAIAKTNRYEVR